MEVVVRDFVLLEAAQVPFHDDPHLQVGRESTAQVQGHEIIRDY